MNSDTWDSWWQAGWDLSPGTVVALDAMRMCERRARYLNEKPVAWIIHPKWAYTHLVGKPSHVFGIPARIFPLPDNHTFYLLTI